MRPRWLSLRPVTPADFDKVTPAWMQTALAAHHPDAIVSAVKVVTRDEGTNRRARFEIAYAKGDGPKTVFVKAHKAAHRLVHLRNGNLFGEARLFASGAPLAIEHPLVYCAVPDYPRLDFLLVMEDLTARGADPRDATRPMTPAEVANGLRGLASLHRQFWNKPHAKLKWVETWAPTAGWQLGLRKRTPLGIARAIDLLPPALQAATGDSVIDQWARFVSTLRAGPQTLLHGDAHIGNTYVLPNDQVGFLDWQVVRRGGWSQDVGYFLVGALAEDDRRVHERALLEIYRDALLLPRAQAPSADEVFLRYRASQAYGLGIWLSTLGADGYQRPEISRALVSRYGAAFAELDTARALDKVAP